MNYTEQFLLGGGSYLWQKRIQERVHWPPPPPYALLAPVQLALSASQPFNNKTRNIKLITRVHTIVISILETKWILNHLVRRTVQEQLYNQPPFSVLPFQAHLSVTPWCKTCVYMFFYFSDNFIYVLICKKNSFKAYNELWSITRPILGCLANECNF